MSSFEKNPATPQMEEKFDPVERKEEEKVLTLDELRALYGGGGRGSKGYHGAQEFPSRRVFVCALLGLLGCIILTIVTISSYAFPVTVIGNKRFAEGNLDIFSFIVNRIGRIRNMADAISDQSAEAILGVFGFVQAALAVLVAVIVLVSSITYTIVAAVRFFHRKDTVCVALLGMMRWNFVAYVIYPFIVNTSGGEGDAYYSIGFAPGIGMDIGMALGLGILCAVAISMRPANREEWQILKKTWGCAAIEATISTCGCGLICSLSLYSVFIYVFTSSLGSVVGAIASGVFSFSGFAFTFFNLLLLISAMTEYQLLAAVAEKSWKILVCRSAFLQMQGQPPKKKRRTSRTGRLLSPSIFSALCLVCAIALEVPSIGLGWSIQMIPQLIALTVIDIAGFIACLVWKKVFRKKDRPQKAENVSVAAMET